MGYIAPIAKWRIDSDEERNLAKKADADFVARKDYIEFYFYAAFNTQENHELFTNKSEKYKVFGKFYKRDILTIDQDLPFDVFKEFVKKHPRYIVKPLPGSLGQEIKIVSDDSYDFFSSLVPKSSMTEYICEELIVQSLKMGSSIQRPLIQEESQLLYVKMAFMFSILC